MNFAGYTEAEIQRWLHLRAIEWSGFPGYISQIVAPILFIFYPWWQVLLAVVVIGGCAKVSPQSHHPKTMSAELTSERNDPQHAYEAVDRAPSA